MEYASAVWEDKDSLERIQRRAACWITSTYGQKTSVSALLKQLKLEPLENVGVSAD